MKKNHVIQFLFYFIIVKSKDRVKPRALFANRGETTEFTCFSENNVEWYFQNGVLPPNAVPIVSTPYHQLKITNVDLSNEGFYQCIIMENDVLEDEGSLTVSSK